MDMRLENVAGGESSLGEIAWCFAARYAFGHDLLIGAAAGLIINAKVKAACRAVDQQGSSI